MSGILPETFVPGFHDEEAVKKMTYNDFGATGLKVSKLSFGTAVFSDIYNDVDLEKCKETLIYALKRGINYIDTAPYYGQGQSEEVLGKILEGVPRKAYYIATKVGRYEKELKSRFNFTAVKTKESIDISLKKLKLDYVDVVQVHDMEFAPSLNMILNETLPAVEQIVKSGKARFMGITGYTLSMLAECVEKSTIKLDTLLNFARLTIIDDSLKEYLPIFKKHDIVVINAAANALGCLTNFGERPWHFASKQFKGVCAEARKLCVQNDVELGKLAVWHSLQQEGPATTLVGMDSVKVVDYNLSVLQDGLTGKEKQIYGQVVKIFESKLECKHWENLELDEYLRVMGRPASVK